MNGKQAKYNRRKVRQFLRTTMTQIDGWPFLRRLFFAWRIIRGPNKKRTPAPGR